MVKENDFSSALAPYMKMLIEEKRSLGYKYDEEERTYRRFDRYWIQHCKNSEDIDITQESLYEWLTKKPTESKSYHGHRVSVIKQLTMYMNSLGLNVYVPLDKIPKEKVIVHVLDRIEVKELFNAIDAYSPSSLIPINRFFKLEYPIIFRLILVCGLRCGEAVSIRNEDIDFSSKTIKLLNSKGQKDRLIYLTDDMTNVLRRYCKDIAETLGFLPYWTFPGRNSATHISRNSLEFRFRMFWNQTNCSRRCEKAPTIHCLRHTFTVMRINEWMAQGVDVKVMLPYLSKYLGHASPSETFYYYHVIDEAFTAVRKIDHLADYVIPEARRI